MKKQKILRWHAITVVLLFALGGAFSAWIMNDNNLLQGAVDDKAVERRTIQRRTDMLEAFFIGGTLSALAGAGALWLVGKITKKHDVS